MMRTGGIGFDVADLLSHDEKNHSSTNVDDYLAEYVRWSVDMREAHSSQMGNRQDTHCSRWH